jgi:hypothetical protein
MRNDLARPRAGFRLREDGTLSTRTCEQCGKLVYVVPEGFWRHWATLAPECVSLEAPRTDENVACGPTVQECGPYPLDSPTRGLARASLTSTYRRGSWEFMGCVDRRGS